MNAAEAGRGLHAYTLLAPPWQTEELAAIKRYHAYIDAADQVRGGMRRELPEHPASDPWLKLVLADNEIARFRRTARGPAAVDALDDAEFALWRAREGMSLGGLRAANAMYELADRLAGLSRHKTPPHIARKNQSRKAGGDLRLSIRGRVREMVALEDPHEILDHFTSTRGWTLESDVVWDGSSTSPTRKRIVSWGRFTTVVSEERIAFRKSITPQPVP